MKDLVQFSNAGQFLSRGHGRHPERIIDSAELIFVSSGILGIQVDEQDFLVRRGEVLLIPPGIAHAGTKDYPPDLSFFWGHFYGMESGFPRRMLHGKAARPERMAEYFRLLLSEQKEEQEDRNTCDLLMELLLNEVRKSFRSPASAGDGVTETPPMEGRHYHHRLAEEAFRILKIRFREPLSTSLIARELRCNPDYLGRVFRQRFRCTLTECLNRIRIGHAEKLLKSSCSSIQEIALDSGFGDAGYFRKLFFRCHAVTPARYRRMFSGGHVNTE